MTTMFEWQRHSQASTDVPHYTDLLEFVYLRAQASENDSGSSSKKGFTTAKPVASFAASADTSSNCVVCKSEKHPLYLCSMFKALSHDRKMSTLKSNGLCTNCMRPGHFMRNCKSIHQCKVCQKIKPHHTLLHLEEKVEIPNKSPTNTVQDSSASTASIAASHAAIGIKPDLLAYS